MANPAILTLGGYLGSIEAGSQLPIVKAVSGLFSLLNGAAWTPSGLVGASVQADGSVQKNGSTFAFDAGVVSSETITSGDALFEYVANVAPQATLNPTSDFGGKMFLAGLTTKTSVSALADIDYGLQVFEAGVVIVEAGVIRRNARASRNNGIYSVGIESGQVVYRADGQPIYRSGVPITYPMRVGALFYNPNDHIGGTPSNTFTYGAFNEAGNAAGSFSTVLGSTIWNSPTTRGRYRIRVHTSNYLIGFGEVDVLKRFPTVNDPSTGLPCPSRWYQYPPDYPVNEEVFDDLGGNYNAPYTEPVRRWKIEFNSKLKANEAAILDAFYNEHRAAAYPFYFYDPREGVLYDNVRFLKDRGYTRDHQQIWRQSRTIELIRRPL